MALDYTIVIPSRKRAHNMPIVRSLLPTALICVDEREIADYRFTVPKAQLLIHPPMEGLAHVINWIMDTVQSEILIECDDDLRSVASLTGSRRVIRDPDQILAILENAAQCCKDLGLGAFCFSRTPNRQIVDAKFRPIVPVQLAGSVFGVMGDARRRHYDPRFLGRNSIDWTLETLKADRCLYADIRYFFDCGLVFSGRGGNVGLVSPEQFNDSSADLLRKWGKNLTYKPPTFLKKRSVSSIGLRVSRTSRTAQR